MKKYIIFLMLLIVSSFSLVQAETFGYGRTETIPINYSLIPTVNNTDHFGGYSVSTLYTYYKSLFDDVYCKLTGCTMTGDIDMDGNDITNAGDITADNFIGDGSELDGVLTDDSNYAKLDEVNAFTNNNTFEGAFKVLTGAGNYFEVIQGSFAYYTFPMLVPRAQYGTTVLGLEGGPYFTQEINSYTGFDLRNRGGLKAWTFRYTDATNIFQLFTNSDDNTLHIKDINLNVTGDVGADSFSVGGVSGYTGDCVNGSYDSGLMVGCND